MDEAASPRAGGSGAEFLRRFLQHVLPRGFHEVRYYGLWNPTQREQSVRAWVLLILASPGDAVQTRATLFVSYDATDRLRFITLLFILS